MHQHLMGGRAAAAALYPPDLITAILRGMRDTADLEEAWVDDNADELMLPSRLAGLIQDVVPCMSSKLATEDVGDDVAHGVLLLKHGDGSTDEIRPGDHFKERYLDEYTNEPLSLGTRQEESAMSLSTYFVRLL